MNDALEKSGKDGALIRIALCVLAGLLAVSAAETLLEGKPLWEQYGPWVRENRVQAIVLAAAVFYGLSLLLYPQEGETNREPSGGAEDPSSSYTPC